MLSEFRTIPRLVGLGSGGAAPPFSPSDIAGLVQWLKADSLGLTDGAAVTTWTDSSSGGNTISQATTARKPLFKANQNNGQPCVRFDGVDDWLGSAGFACGTTFTLFIVFRDVASIDNYCQLWATNGGDGLYYRGGAASKTIDWFSSTDKFMNTRLIVGQWFYVTFSVSAGAYTFYRNGVADGSGTGINSATITKIGNDHADTADWNGDVAEVIFYNSALSSTDRGKVWTYLTSKYSFVDTDALDFFTRVVSNGGTISANTQTAVDTFVKAAKVNGYWSKLNRINLFCGDQLVAATVPLKVGGGSALDTNNGFVAGDYTEATGLKGNGSSKYINTGLTPSASLTANDTHQAFYIRGTVADTPGTFGSLGGSRLLLEPPASSGPFLDDQYDSGNGRVSSSNVSPSGFIVGSRTASNAHTVYRNGSSIGSNTTSGGTFANVNVAYFIFAFNAGSAGNFSKHTLAAYSLGAGLTAADVTNYNTDMQAFQTALARNV